MSQASSILYLISSVMFIMALRGLSSAKTAQEGNWYGIAGMCLAVFTTLLHPNVTLYSLIFLAIAAGGIIGIFIAKKIQMTALPQLVAAFHSLVGLAAVFVACAALHSPEAFKIAQGGHIYASSLIEMALGAIIGAITFTGSIVAFCKLQGLLSGKPIIFNGQHKLNAGIGLSLVLLTFIFLMTGGSTFVFTILLLLSLALGLLLIIPIGGADMPVVISMLNSYSGWAASGIGFTLNNHLLIITGALVGSSGAILSYIMCKGMNRSIFNVILGGFGVDPSQQSSSGSSDKPVKVSTAEEASFLLCNSPKIIIVPGYGMAVAQAQHSLREVGELLTSKGAQVRYAIHPVAGRMPGHMNVLLAEANVPYEQVQELEEINSDFATTDAVIVIGANDITNPAAKTDPSSPIFGMPILDVEKARLVFFIKRSLAPGYAGVDNELFYKDNVFMVLGDAKKVCEEFVKHLSEE